MGLYVTVSCGCEPMRANRLSPLACTSVVATKSWQVILRAITRSDWRRNRPMSLAGGLGAPCCFAPEYTAKTGVP